MGYFLAGWDVIGMDIKPQPEYPFRFIKADVLQARIPWHKVQAVHASPVCKRHTNARHASTNHNNVHPDQIEPTRAMLIESGLPYVIENVVGAPLIDPVTLCGSMFNLHTEKYELKRHRLFEMNWTLPKVLADRCGQKRAISIYGDHPKTTVDHYREDGSYRRRTVDMPYGYARQLMGAPWVRNMRQLSQGIPVAYTSFIGYHMRELIS